jgi:hypothetical protein
MLIEITTFNAHIKANIHAIGYAHIVAQEVLMFFFKVWTIAHVRPFNI